MKLSARNRIPGKVIEIVRGAVMAKVVLEIAGGQRITSAILVESVDDLGLKVGDAASAVIKATEIMVSRD
jgi:molybdopterin-binding protein